MAPSPYRPTRRTFLAASAAAVGLAACSASNESGADDPTATGAADGLAADGLAANGTTPSTAPSTAPSPSSTTPRPPGATAQPNSARFVTRADGTAGNVALTFHTDGELAMAQQVLDILAARNAFVTNFIVGKWLDANPAWAKKLTGAGHELANHTYSHAEFATLSPSAMASEITKARDVMQRLAGGGTTYFRPSGTDDGLAQPSAAVMQAASDAGYAYVIGWDVEPYDYKDPGAAAVRERVLAGVKPGSIISLHFGHRGTIDALPAILDGLASKQLAPVTLSTLLG